MTATAFAALVLILLGFPETETIFEWLVENWPLVLVLIDGERDVEEVQLRVVQVVRQLEEAGQVTVVRGDSDDAFI